MKPFNLEEARAGKPVCTRNGKDARIICWDARATSPLVALVDRGYQEALLFYKNDGVHAAAWSTYDLFMKSTTEKRWAVYYEADEHEERMPYLSRPYKKDEIPRRLASLCNIRSHLSAHVVEFEIEV